MRPSIDPDPTVREENLTLKGTIAIPVLAVALTVAAAQRARAQGIPPVALEYPEPELAERIVFANDVFEKLMGGSYDELDAMALRMRTEKARFRNGSWKLSAFYRSFSWLEQTPSWHPVTFVGEDPDWAEVFSRLEDWRAARPGSMTARVAAAHTWLAYAWEARTRRYADRVTDEQWAVFRVRLDKAADILEEGRALPERCPEWWVASMRLALGQGWARERFNALLDEAVAYEPEYDDFYAREAQYLLPRWFGETGEWERMTGRWAQRLGEGRGAEIYARVLWSLRDLTGQDLFKHYQPDWPVAKRGFQVLMEKYPDSLEIRSQFAHFSFQARDREQARPLMAAIGNRLDKGVWRSDKQFRRCRDWAQDR